MTRRRVKPEELELWQTVARSIERRAGRELDLSPRSTPRKPQPEPGETPVAPLPRFTIGEKHPSRNESHLPPMSVSDRLAQAPVHMDSKAFGRMKRGKLVPEARIDLHGMTLDQAHPELVRFIMTSQARGLRLVLVITGKGQRHDPYDPMPLRRGVLKQQVPQWLKMAPLGTMVLQVSEAHLRHGGGGAYYVYLRKRR
ncbi:Smr/MutS family protein [Mesobacterium sp. TK19101]|uniref:Smr/MutS family protein n=1 Tax=Mesobacterium hydrothermale TaxID=3111907 RepID=A0ABU6HHP8_9RHOB|nr:Smr/MutS family protein [Mesobacterium sp. TK19101]MEC3861355.1 Smr/MutS family protein [Mesobacterium sp. TK19101]